MSLPYLNLLSEVEATTYVVSSEAGSVSSDVEPQEGPATRFAKRETIATETIPTETTKPNSKTFEDGWRRTSHGWENRNEWALNKPATTPGKLPEFDPLPLPHPFFVSVGFVLVSLVVLLVFPKNRRTPPHRIYSSVDETKR